MRAWICLLTLLVPAATAPAASRGLTAVVADWARARGRPLQPDPTLQQACGEHAAALAELAGPLPGGAQAHLRFLLRRHGVSDALVQASAIRVPAGAPVPARLRSLLQQRVRSGEFTHFGVATVHGQGGTTLVLVLTRRLVRLRVTTRGHQLRACVRPLSHRVNRPTLLMTYPGGGILERRLRAAGPEQRCLALPTGGRGRYQLEVMVNGRLGPEVAAMSSVYIGVRRPSLPTHKLYPQATSQDHVEIQMLRLLNRTRSRHGLSLLRPSGQLASLARAHSEDMMRNNYFGHRSPTEGPLEQRVSSLGARLLQADENLALATSIRKAHDALLASPSHRRTLLDPRATRVGVGIVAQPHGDLLYVTQILARFAGDSTP